MSDDAALSAPKRTDIGNWVSQGWEWFLNDAPLHLAIGFFALLLISVGNGVLAGPVMAALSCSALRAVERKKVELGDFFEGFRYFVWSLLAFLLIAVLSLIGLVVLIVPGLVIMTMYMFTFHFIADQKKDFWQAMEASRQFVSRDYMGFTMFFLLLAFFNLLGLLFFGVGLIFSIPVSWLALTAAYLSETQPQTAADSPPIVIE